MSSEIKKEITLNTAAGDGCYAVLHCTGWCYLRDTRGVRVDEWHGLKKKGQTQPLVNMDVPGESIMLVLLL